MSKRIPIIIFVAIVAAVGLAACGSSDDTTSVATEATTTSADADATTGDESSDTATTTDGSGKGGTVQIEADPSGALAFTQTRIDAPAGSDTIEFSNPSGTDHNVEIEDPNGEDVAETDTIADGKTSTTADLQPGTYTFYCAIPGHREAGMEGTITVK